MHAWLVALVVLGLHGKGVVQFDGRRSKQLFKSPTFVMHIVPARDAMWIGSTLMVHRLRQGKLDEKQLIVPLHLRVSPTDVPWIGNQQDVSWFDGTWHALPLPGAGTELLHDLEIDDQGRVWILFGDKLLYTTGTGWTTFVAPPQQDVRFCKLATRGDRLVFSNGILILAGLAILLIALFRGETHALIPLYAVGVFLAFTLSQAGMARHWLTAHGAGWPWRLALNGGGALVTAVVTGVIAVTKFTHGAWIVVVLIPVIVAVFTRSACASITRASAGTSSPSSRRSTSPGTSASTGSAETTPSRSALTSRGRSFRNAARARSARYSWKKEKRPFTTITPTMATPIVPMPSPGWWNSA